jgi:hypothetical protein
MLSSCTQIPFVRVTNNTSQPIAVSSLYIQQTIISAIGPGEKTEIRGAFSFSVLRNGRARLYDTPRVDYKDHTVEGFGPFVKVLIKLSYAEDGCVYLVPPGHDAEATLRDIQPAGFPICPTATN